MAGTKQQVTCRTTEGRVCWPAIIVLLAVIGPGAMSADFLIVERPDELHVLNVYQQEATREERHTLVPFEPMKVVRLDELLDDGFTRCMRVEVAGKQFYFIKEHDGTLGGKAGLVRTVNGVAVMDTVRILTPVRLTPIRSTPVVLQKGTLVVRLFRERNATYCRTIGPPLTFGWIAFGGLKEGHSWKIVKAESNGATSISPPVVRKIRSRMAETNTVLNKLYAFFNARNHDRRVAPRWNVFASDRELLCTLDGSPTVAAFEQSTIFLANEIERNLLGSGLQVTYSPGRIEIKPRE